MISIQLIDTKSPVPNGRVAKQNFITPIGIPDHAWKCTIRSPGISWPRTTCLLAVWWFPWILRKQNPINANGGTNQQGKGSVNYWSMNYCLSASPTGLKRSFVTPEKCCAFYLNQDSKYTMNHL
jgi:hypothetical protein